MPHGFSRTLNETIIEAWNTVLFDKFARYRHLLVAGLSGHSEEAFRRHRFGEGQRVLDVGCGFGDSTLRIAQQVGDRGRAVGIDCASRFIDEADRDRREQHVHNAEFLVADAQTADLGGPYDHAFARFGTMFFELPGAAMRNIRRALRPDGTFTMIVWRRRQDNPWLHEAELAVKEILPVVAHEDTEQVHCGPGPFSMSGPDLVSDLLRSAGYDRIRFERFDTDICIGRDLNEALAFALDLGPAGEIIRLAGPEGTRRRPQAIEALRSVLKGYVREDGVWAPSSTWFVRARRP